MGLFEVRAISTYKYRVACQPWNLQTDLNSFRNGFYPDKPFKYDVKIIYICKILHLFMH